MTDRARSPGFTLVELVISLAVTAIVIAGVMAAVITQEKAYYRTQRTRAAQSSARAALLFIEDKLRLAGFGMDAALAFDFGVYSPPAATCPAEAAPCVRDGIGANDELVFYARNPAYWVPNGVSTSGPVGRAWNITTAGVSGTAVSVTANAGDVFPNGQILLAVCPGGRYYAYMTVGATTSAALAGTLSVPLAAVDPTNPFKRQDLAAGPGSDPPQYFNSTMTAFAAPAVAPTCFANGARLFQIDRYRFHVRPIAVGGFPGGKKKYDPYLVLDMGVDTNLDGVVDDQDELVIAEGIEIMQVAYSMANTALATPTVGITPNIAITFKPGVPGSSTSSDTISTTAQVGTMVPAALPLTFPFAPTLQPVDNAYAAASWYSYTLTAPFPNGHPRLTDSQANIRSVRVALVARSPEPDPSTTTPILLDGNFRLYNLSAVPAWISANAFPNANDGYERVQVETSVAIPNMSSRGMTFF